MTDLGMCQIKLETCNRTATVRLTLSDTRTGAHSTYRVCDEHAKRLMLIDGAFYWQVEREDEDDE